LAQSVGELAVVKHCSHAAMLQLALPEPPLLVWPEPPLL
jgi:hypothetical protein